MYMESLEDDNFEEFKGGSLQIKQEMNRFSSDNSPEPNFINDNEINVNIVHETSSLSNLIAIPKRITDTLWNCHNNNLFSRSLTSSSGPGGRVQEDDAHDYFTFRKGVVDKAVNECIEKLNLEVDDELISTFLLTEITTWDTEKERLVLLTNRAVFSIKYDFIAQKKLEHKKINLKDLDSVVLGDLVYPTASLVPRLNGIANAVSDVIKAGIPENNSFCERDRKTRGIRLIWNNGVQKGFTQRWNPFTNENPYVTFTSHPLFNHSECSNDNQKDKYSLDVFCQRLINCVETVTADNSCECRIKYNDIVLSTYLGLGSLIYNRNSLGFFKVRGKFSF